ncbi:flagellar assembly protein FliH [Nocardioides carbamazepini]|uniref:FliH/SctL family protein n=1 Tax=Nocardioides carbamazepini TaxID=2854259 RepID=UPI00214A597A|nr:flagellar assembly protein FliH [Nocardioides carbamazepini]MCR1786368.1 flagellar assembly protein FliH [Nocardioides carbamazepini]
MSSSSEAAALPRPELPELRVGTWTRLGSGSVLGDAVTESLLDGIATQARDAARAQGYAVGWAEGRRAAAAQAAEEESRRAAADAAAQARREAEHRAALDALGRAAEQVRGLLDDLARAVEDQATDLAWSLTTTLIGTQVARLGPQDVVARVLQVLPPAPVGRVRLHPATAGSTAAQELVARGLEVVPDPALGSADALVEGVDGSVVDLRIREAMARVREVLS